MDLFLIAGAISFLSLDTTIAFQMMISSPIFACPIIGWLMGDIALGFELGAMFQLLWLGKIPAGAASTPEGNLATMTVTALIISYQNLGFPNATLALFFAEGIIVSYLGAKITIVYRKINGKILQVLMQRMDRLRLRLFWFAEIFSIIAFVGIMFIFVIVILKINHLFIADVIKIIGGMFESPLIVVKPIIWGLGVAAVLPLIKPRGIQK